MKFLNCQPKTKAILWFVQFILILLALVLSHSYHPIIVNSDISRMFNSEGDSELNAVNNQIEQQAVKSQILLVGHTNKLDAIADSNLLAMQLNQINGVGHVKHRYENLPNINLIVEQYLPYRQLLLSEEYKNILLTKSNDELFERQFSLLNQMVDPNVSLTLEHDFTLSLADYLSRPYLPTNTLTLESNHLITQYNNKYYVLIVFETNASGLDINKSQNVVEQIKKLVPSYQSEILYTGSIFYASEASATGQFEMTLFSSISMLIMLLLVFLGYRYVSSLMATLCIILISILYGICALVVVFDEVSIIALIFSITLIGISADYSFHSLSEILFTKCESKNPLKSIHKSLTMGFLTTLAGYVILLFSPFVLFQQIALFTMSGLTGAYLTALLFFPWLMTKKVNKTSSFPLFITKLNQYHQRLTHRLSASFIVASAVIVVSISVTFFNHFNDDVRSFYAVSNEIKINENKVKSILGQKDEPQYVLVSGKDSQSVLEQEEIAIALLNQHVKSGDLTHYKAITQWIPSVKSQQHNAQLMIDANTNALFDKTSLMLGQSESVLRNDLQSLKYLTLDIWLKTPFGQLFKHQFIHHNATYYSVIRLSGLTNFNAIQATFADSNNVFLINKVDDISKQIAQFRTLLVNVLIMALIAAWLVFAIRFGIKIASAAISIPGLAIIISLAISMLMQGELNIFNMVASVLILALGLDYSVYYAEHGFQKTITLTTLMSALSSIAVFAVLLLSSMPAIQSFGLTVFIGVLLVFFLSPQVTKWQATHE